MNSPKLFFALLLLLGLVQAQAQAQTATREITVHSTSPFIIARLVNQSRDKSHPERFDRAVDLKVVWAKLGINVDNWEACGAECRATIFITELDGKRDREAILKLTRSYNDCRFLIFKEVHRQGGSWGWKFIGNIDHDFNRYEMASHRTRDFQGRPWLVIRGQEGSGSGFSLYRETWYEVSQKGLRSVLSYPVDGNTSPWPSGVDRFFKARPSARSAKTENRLIVSYRVDYQTMYDQIPPVKFTNHHHACYRWKPAQKTFAFDPACSDISEREIDAIANVATDDNRSGGQQIGGSVFFSDVRAFVGGGYEVFLKYNFERLKAIAKSRSHSEWLRQFLNDCADIPEKTKLLLALGKQR